MKRRVWIGVCLGLVLSNGVRALEDPGQAKIGLVNVTVYHATDGKPETIGGKSSEVARAMVDRMRNVERLRFKHYRLLGQDVQPLLRSYENWAQPLKPSDEVLVRFEAQGRPTKQTAVLDLELWLGRKKTVKTDVRLEGGRPLFVLGPQWRGGRLIIMVALAPEQKPGS